ncbi:hypothetical protein BD769DRAFT_1389844 [Suillus cothurnatus]|nr:hypothetical protein BD769DRAFT_1389844 [Suillus cothurnatus]
MNNNNNADADGGVRNQNRDQDHQIPGHLLQHEPRPRNVMFTMPGRQLELMYITWAAARNRVRQQLYNPNLPYQPYPRPPVWSDEIRAMMVLWIARERRIFEMEIEELEYLLGLRAQDNASPFNGANRHCDIHQYGVRLAKTGADGSSHVHLFTPVLGRMKVWPS